MTSGVVRERLARVRERVAAACESAGRDASDVALLLATKTQDTATIRAALVAAGDAPVLLGENRVQELVAKAPQLADLSPTWHVIGPLQSNKVNAALRWASCIESVASIDLARRLAERATGRLDVMVQVNVSGEPTKHGVTPAAAAELAQEVAGLPGLRLVGFMTVGARSSDASVVAAGYDALRAVRDDVLASGLTGTGDARHLSMGMSGDLELAIACGATLVRVGTAVFGSR
ncbi:YggS family pyridoxal phosphate-dependent enzyme [Cellulomonas composti]|uniref:YggS family pyridoxal phosphate-dependent enzyme n=1 Tax=Cellulomonas composti TaxID=266130 RepID=UPI001FE86F1F|nr:YggS family pyridoxal phosphate-dependent enzyme [Cellulomonas composti]